MTKPKPPRLYGMAEIAAALGVPRGRLAIWRNRGKMPPPDVSLAMGPVWTARTIEPWIARQQTDAERGLGAP